VFDFVTDERNEPRYNPRMLNVQLTTDEPIGLGSTFRAEVKTPRGSMPMTIEFTAFDWPRRLASATRSSMMETVGAITFDPAAEGTRMRWAWEVRPGGILRLMPAVVALVGRRQERNVWGSLKRLLESEARPTEAETATAGLPPDRTTSLRGSAPVSQQAARP
jgi:hypothetical protein